MNSVVLAIVLIVALLAAFVFLHTLLVKVPYTDTAPRERFRWPVWKWYPLAVISLLVIAMMGNVIYVRSRRDRSVLSRDTAIRYQAGHESTPADRVMIAGKDRPLVATVGSAGRMTTGTSGKATKATPTPKKKH